MDILITVLIGRKVGQSLGSAKYVENFKTRFQGLHVKLNTVAIFQVLHTGEFILNILLIVLIRSREF